MTERIDVFRKFWPKWTLANAIAWLIGFGIIGNLGSDVLFGLLFGVVVGTMQGLVLGWQVRWTRWLLASSLGWALGLVIAKAVFRIAPGGTSEFLFHTLLGTIGGAFSTALQYFLQWRDTHRSSTWLLTFSISGAIGGLLSGYIMWALLEAAFNYTGAATALGIVGSLIAGGAFFGLITAFPFVRLLQHLVPTNKN
jgi:hypothetical protein